MRVFNICREWAEHLTRDGEMLWGREIIAVGIVEIGWISQIALHDVADLVVRFQLHQVECVNFGIRQETEIAHRQRLDLCRSIQRVRVKVGYIVRWLSGVYLSM